MDRFLCRVRRKQVRLKRRIMVSLCSVAVLLLLAVVMMRVSRGGTFTCPPVCRCTADTLGCTGETESRARGTSSTTDLRLAHLPLTEVQSGTFQGLINVSRIEISQSDSIRKIQSEAFLSIHNLIEISILNIIHLLAIEKGAFADLPRLRYLSICNTGIRHFPDFTHISSLGLDFFLEMGDNMQINSIPANAFQGISKADMHMNLVRNGFTEIDSHAFNGTRLEKLILKDNRHLIKIHDDAFEGAEGPNLLRGLREVKVLIAHSTPSLKILPPLETLAELQEADLTYPSHCCAFNTWKHDNKETAVFGRFKNLTMLCNMADQTDSMDPSGEDLNDINFHYPDLELCISSSSFKCTPEPDAFNPCEDLLGHTFLRAITWIVTVFSLVGNLAVLLVLLLSHQKLGVSRFLMCNLAFADLCMGFYLLLIALADYRSRQEYYNHAMDWQTGMGCGIAGFLTVFSSELSIYTLTMITLERWHTITHAMQMSRRLRLRHMVTMMAIGWGFSLLMALLPVIGVSSYTKVSICLPMDIETPVSQGYVVAVLVINVAAFLMVCSSYAGIYLSVHNPNVPTRHGDTRMAKRMAVLIFTDFLCMAPISFFAISAALHMPLITVSQSKILLILFYPINSLCNPFLYTIFTRAFRRDMCLLLSRCGCCHTQAEFYRSQGLSGVTLAPKKKSVRKSHSNHFRAYHKLQGCFFNKAAT
ncbi:lutropin-choriogonadotropic hormone receptor-like isoform X2 [Neoarius graeffei]|uniref:lutropin-choriogonadotropic hormone receptor-like isoform X2 n=1 Tax=Neoarius graeffei TaxID=443677 RepID=UPI00298C6F1C|nr:lutropin-choriogonadotropic hormone receptor-like isoform X2 [Neoarius graeffei]